MSCSLQVLERRKGVNMRVNTKERGDVFGEVSLLYNCPRTATVAATSDATVWVLERDVRSAAFIDTVRRRRVARVPVAAAPTEDEAT